MSRKRLREAVMARHIEIYESDWTFLEEHFGRNSSTRYGVGPLIRDIVHQKVQALRAKQIEAIDQRAEREARADVEMRRMMTKEGATDA